MGIHEEQNMAILSIDDILKIREYFPLTSVRSRQLSIEYGIEPVEGSWTRYKIIDKQKLMLFIVKYGISNQ